MKDTFFRLSKDKQLNLVNACKSRFAENTYDNISLNSIIEKANISKGGLFKYIDDKKDLYTYIINLIMKELIEYQAENIDLKVKCYFDRIKSSLSYGFNYYKNHELEFHIIMNAFYDISSPCYEDVIKIRENNINLYQYNLLEGIDWSLDKESQENILKFSKYTIDGYNISLMKKIKIYKAVNELESIMTEDIDLIINVLKKGMKG